MDAHLLVVPANLEEFREEVETWLAEIRPLVFMRMMFSGRMVNAMTDEAMRLDVWLHDGERAEVTLGESRVLYERMAIWHGSRVRAMPSRRQRPRSF